MTTAIYAASLDPVTRGHLWMIEQGVRLFGRLIVAIGANPEKRYVFDETERLDMLRASLAETGLPVVETEAFPSRFLVDYARDRGASFLLRGIRNETDYGFERTMRHVNADLAPEITTVVLMPPRDLSEVSSSFIRGLIGYAGWEKVVARYVTPAVMTALAARYGEG